MALFRRRKKEDSTVVSTLLMSVLFGSAAGIVGALVAASFAPATVPVTEVAAPRVERASSVIPGPAEAPSAVADALQATAALHRQPASSSGDVLARTYLPSDAVGAAFVVTSDGWLVTSSDVLSPDTLRRDAWRVVLGGEAYQVEEAVADPFSGVTFVRVRASNLPVTAFSAGRAVVAGRSAYLFDADGGVRRADVIGYGEPSAQSPNDLLQSSERIQKLLRLNGAVGGIPAGGPVVDGNGEVLGLFLGTADDGSAIAVPFDVIGDVISSVLRDRTASRPFLGVNYVDLARTRGVSTYGTRPRGALLVEPADVRVAVRRASPAAAAGLRAGDLIIAVNGEELSATTALSDLLAQYAPRTTLTLTVFVTDPDGGATDRSIQVTLGEAEE